MSKEDEEFNRIISELNQKLKLSYRKDGVNYWYDNSLELLCQLLGFVFIREGNGEAKDGKS